MSSCAGGGGDPSAERLRRRGIVAFILSFRLNTERTRATVRRKLAGGTAQFEETFARVVCNTPAERIERLMRAPLRGALLKVIFRQMPRHFDRKRGAGMNSSIRWVVTGRMDGTTDVYQLEIEDGHCRVVAGARGSAPALTITLDGVELLRLAAGCSDPMQAYFSGRVTLAGDIMVAARLSSLFRIPRASKPR